MSKQEQVHLNALLARAIYASGAPFSIVENKHWLAFFKALRPVYVVPSRYLVSEPLPVLEYHQTRLAALAKVAEVDAVTVMCDGWSNIRHEPIINFILSVPQPVFWKSTHTELESHTSEYIAEKVSEVIQEVKQECGKMTVAVVTDNASNMKKAWKLLSRKHPELICYGCAAHSLNLVFLDLLQLVTLKQVKNQAKTIVKELKSKHMLVDLLKNMQQLENVNTTLKLPVKQNGDLSLLV